MSAPDTNIEKQERRHKGPMTGMKAAIGFALVLFLGLIVWTSYQADNETATTPAQILSGSN